MSQISLFAPAEPSIAGIDLAKLCASYSGDTIPSGKVRKPVSCNGDLWFQGGGGGSSAGYDVGVFRLAPADEFDGPTYTYSEKTCIRGEADKYPGDFARNDPNGFYHGIRIKHGGEDYVISGPELPVHVDAETIRAIRAAEAEEWKREDAEEDDHEDDYAADLLDDLEDEDGEDVEQNHRDAEAGGARDPRNHRPSCDADDEEDAA